MIKLGENEFKVLVVLSRNMGKSVHSIAYLLNLKLSWTLRIVNKLEEVGLVKSKKISRTRLVQITSQGLYFADFYRDRLRNERKKKKIAN